MDDLSLLSSIRSEVAPADAVELRVARAKLFDAIAVEVERDARRSIRARRAATPALRRLRWSGGLALVATGIAAAAIVASAFSPEALLIDRPDSAVASPLEAAAEIAADRPDVVVPPGHYIRQRITYSSTNYAASPTGNEVWRSTEKVTWYINPVDDNDWVGVFEAPVAVAFLTPGAEAAAAQRAQEFAEQYGAAQVRRPPADSMARRNVSLADLPTMPREPAALLSYFETLASISGNDPASADFGYWVFREAADVLRLGVVPSDLRAAIFETIQLIPGIDVDENIATNDGRSGTAVAAELAATPDGGYPARFEFIFDPDSAELIGDRLINVLGDEFTPAGSPDFESSYTFDVVASAP